MQTTTQAYRSAIIASSRQIKAKVEVYNSNILVATYTESDNIKSLDIDRSCENGKFFGFLASQKLTLKLNDKNRSINIGDSYTFEVSLGVVLPDTTVEYKQFPVFYLDKVERDENTNELTITAYDFIEQLKNYTVSQLTLNKPYRIDDFIVACCNYLGITYDDTDIIFNGTEDILTEFSFADGANFDGTETLYNALRQVAEATGTIMHMNSTELNIKNISNSVYYYTLGKANYFTFSKGSTYNLKTICSTTELGDNVSSSKSIPSGETQYFRNNAFLELREDLDDLLDTLIPENFMDMVEYDLKWRCDPALEIGDVIRITNKDNTTTDVILLNSKITYNGGLSETCNWKYEAQEETASNPTSIGEVLNKTFARVDKQENIINLLSSKSSDNQKNIAQLQIDTTGIQTTITDISKQVEDNNKSATDEIASIKKTLNTKADASSLTIAITTELEKGVDKVVTKEKNFILDDSGLNINDSSSEMSTNINEDGMRIKKNNEEVLTANNKGVKAIDLHADTYLIIGTNSRFENYGNNRTGCFWIGGSE